MTEQPIDWQTTQDEDYLQLCIDRLSGPPLYWVEQFISIINDKSAHWGEESITLNDIGCCTGAFNVGIRDLAKPSIKYQGYDISTTYLDVARQYFPQGQFDLLDIARTQPRNADVTVMSGTLEHVDEWQTALRHICQSTKRLVIMRTFFSTQHEMAYYYKPGSESPYPIYQFTFQEIHEEAEKNGFSVHMIRDKATDSIPKYLGCGITRTQYVCLMTAKG